MLVKVAQTGREVQEFFVEAGTTAGEVVKMAEFDITGDIVIDGKIVNNDHLVKEGDIILVAKNLKGNQSFEVSVIKVGHGSSIKNYMVESPTTVGDVLKLAGEAEYFTSEGKLKNEVRVDNEQNISGADREISPAPGSNIVRLYISKLLKGNN